jgi:hypothetical protein
MRTALCLLSLLVAPVVAHATPHRSPPHRSPPHRSPQATETLCETAIKNTEAASRTPSGMLAAIAQVESGRPDSKQPGRMRPWPWTIDADGVGQFFATKEQAVAAVSQLQAQGAHSIDVGCMQINLMHHPEAFTSLDQAFDPAANVAFAVRFLKRLHRLTGSWPKAIAAYHSDTPWIAADYQRRVLATWQQHEPNPFNGMRIFGTPMYVDSGLIYGAFGSTGRIYGLMLSEH